VPAIILKNNLIVLALEETISLNQIVGQIQIKISVVKELSTSQIE